MIVPNWLIKFQTKLENNNVDLIKSKPILLRDQSDHIKPAQYKDDIIITDIYNNHANHYHLIDPFKHISSKRPGGCLEQSLVKKLCETLVVFDDQTLERIQKRHPNDMSCYHVVLLNAVPDFVNNYFWNIRFQEPKFSCENDEYLVNHQLQCLVFVNDQGSYFCALPAIVTHQMMSDFPELRVVDATIKQVEDLLNVMPLARLQQHGKYYPFQLGSFDSPQVYDESDDRGLSYDYVIQSKIQGCALLTAYINDPTISQHVVDYSCCTLNEQIHDTIFGYLNDNICAEIAQNGDFTFHMKNETPGWTKFFAHHKQMNLLDKQDMDSINLWESDICNLLMYLVIGKMKAMQPSGKTTSETVILTESSGTKPIVSSTGMNKVFLTLGAGHDHKYYFNKSSIFSLYGTQKIDSMEQGDLNG